jgi:hypothetical protein
LARSFVAWSILLSPTLAWGQEATLVQQIGEVSSEVAEAVAAEVTVVPFSPNIDARTTPIIVAPGEAFVHQGRPGQVGGLSRAERKAIRQAYAAGQTILLLHGSVHDVEALHVLVEEGVTHTSSTDPTFLAYAFRQESGIPTVRIVHDVGENLPAPVGIVPDFEDEGAGLQRALDVIISELTHPPVLAEGPRPTSPAAGPVDWKQNPVQSNIITVTDSGNFNTPVDLYALHSCQQNKDYYLVDTGGDWTATDAAFQSASNDAGQIQLDSNGHLVAQWEQDDRYCTAGIDVANGDSRLCLYQVYPLYYEVDIEPPAGPTVVQVNAAPAGDQGQSTSYSSGFSFSIGGGVNVDGEGPNVGFQGGVTWNNDVSTTVPPLVIEAGDKGPGTPPQGTFTRYQYCTAGTTPENCTSTLQITGQSGACQNFIAGPPQQGQTPEGRLSNVAQTVRWQVDPTTYGGSTTFDVTVTWQMEIAANMAFFWWNAFCAKGEGTCSGPWGSCNPFGCSCAFPVAGSRVISKSLTFNVPIPSSANCPSG